MPSAGMHLSSRITLLLALLTAVGPLSTDMYLPAFPAMRASLHSGPGEAQMTLAAWFVGLAIGQVTHGPIADHYGRRAPLLLGTFLYTVAQIGCALSGSMTDLSWWRLWAAFGGAASLVIPRAIIADVSQDGSEAATILGRMVMVMGVAPVLAPSLGGLIAEHWNWRGIFWICAIYGASCCFLIWRYLPDTLYRHRNSRLRAGAALMRYISVWRGRSFRAHALQGGFATFSLFAFLGGAPPVFLQGFELTPAQFGCVFILNALGYIAGVQLNARLTERLGASIPLTFGTVALFVSCLAMTALAAFGSWHGLGIAACMMVCMATLGLVLPGAALGSVLENGRNAGAASALYGTVVFLVGALSTVLVGWAGSDDPLPMALLMVAGAVVALLCNWRRPKRKTDRPSRRKGSRRWRAVEKDAVS
ncbi:multidrug effflux MFS transporter [Acetobacteraceae bacterium KSS8]|uniref:Bcr/CflA family efflux transporter n=1 Tax=Endosaccharibacter trunci TaxID=2812733 RepID=A0ABT1W225_9PROT|nr:multidrug effflux MFS transporter [Acetobacteraceae bacterium KSS8]